MSSQKLIMIADDDSDVLESTQFMLLNEGYNVITGTNGQDAVTKYKEHKPDLVFLDLKMPVMDGYTAFYKIKQHDPNATIIFISSYTLDMQKYEKAKNSTLTDLIDKPFSLEDLVDLIKKHA